MHTEALILIDIQNDYFSGGQMPLPLIDIAAGNAARLLADARKSGRLVIHIRHIGPPNAPFFRTGTNGSEIHQSVRPEAKETVIEKHRPNSFFETCLEEFLNDAGVTKLTLCGAMSQMCVDATTRAAVDLGFQVTLVADACAAASVAHDGMVVPADMVHAAIMAPLAASYAHVVATEEQLRSED